MIGTHYEDAHIATGAATPGGTYMPLDLAMPCNTSNIPAWHAGMDHITQNIIVHVCDVQQLPMPQCCSLRSNTWSGACFRPWVCYHTVSLLHQQLCALPAQDCTNNGLLSCWVTETNWVSAMNTQYCNIRRTFNGKCHFQQRVLIDQWQHDCQSIGLPTKHTRTCACRIWQHAGKTIVQGEAHSRHERDWSHGAHARSS